MNLLRAAATVGSLTLLSRLTGFLRDAGIAFLLGASAAADAFFVAFKLANLLRRLFAEGAFNAGFVPLFARTLEGEGEEAARGFANAAFSLMSLVLLLVVLAAELAMPWVVAALAPGFAPESERYALAVELSRITFPYLAFISLAAIAAGVLNSVGAFAAAAFAPVLLNLVLIAALVCAALADAHAAYPLAWGVAAAGVAQLALVLSASARAGFPLRLVRPKLDGRMRRLFALVLPGALGAGVYQLSLVIDTWFASRLPEGAVSYLFYADRLNQLPLGAVGVALATALLPGLARALRAGREDEARRLQTRAIEVGMLFAVPATVAFLTMPVTLVEALFGRGEFDAQAVVATAAALAAFAIGLPAYVLVKVLAPGFFAREDTRTPVLIAAFCLLVNIGAILALVGPLAHAGIALATAISSWTNAFLLGLLLWWRGELRADGRLARRLGAIVFASALMGGALSGLERLAAGLPSLARLSLLVPTGLVVYFAAARWAGAFHGEELRSLFRRAPVPAAGDDR
ncbi:putative lipid II flippase MurJ [bacterium HR40]|nr:putative lipid II flippase MurJ [bacterium HR40]